MLMKLVESRGDLTLLPPAVLRLNLDADPASAPVPRRTGPAGARLVARPAESRRTESDALRSDRPKGDSWWTARASAGVSPGFTKSEILAEGPFDPALPDGLFERLGAVLALLSQSLVAG
jgi:hypothetical protein